MGSSAGWSIDSIRLLASKPRFHHPTPRLHRDLYVYTTLFGHHCLIWSYMYPFYHLVPSLNLSLIRVALDVQFFDNALDLTRVYSQMLLIHFCTPLLRPV